jgi:non-heme chloroperoxidase
VSVVPTVFVPITGSDPRGRGRRRAKRDLRRPLLPRFLIAAAALALSGAASAAELRFSTVAGTGGVPLNVVEAGDPAGPEILFVHGMSHSYLAWKEQLRSPALARFRLVAFDLRGHGNSGKPWDKAAYAGSKPWAGDVAAVIAAIHLHKPLLVAWSFGGNVAMDYVREEGIGKLAGILLVGTMGGLIDAKPAPSPKLDKIWADTPLRTSPDIDQNAEGFARAARGLSPHLTPDQEHDAFLAGMMQTGVVRRALLDLALRNPDLVPRLTLPVRLVIGGEDVFSPADTAHALAAELPDARLSVYPGAGHFVQADSSAAFDHELAAFADELAQPRKAK